MTKDKFLESLYNQNDTTVVGSTVFRIRDYDEIKNTPLVKILGLKEDRLSEEALIVIDILENEEDFPYSDHFHALKWKLLALINIQDAFSGVVHGDGYNDELYFSRYYFYYEALHLVREYFYCGFNNFLSASQHLLRTFVEFNIRQCYYDDISWKTKSYEKLIHYFKTGVSPSNTVMINSYLPSGKFSKPLKKKIQSTLAQLSNTSSHAYSPSNSSRGKGAMHHEYSLDTMYFWMGLSHSINAVLWSYFIKNPNVFYPKDILKKFGYNYPMGTYVSEFQFHSVKHSLTNEDFEEFEKFASTRQIVEDLNNFYEMQSDKSEAEIRETWDGDEELKDFEVGYIMQVAKYRAINEMLASKCTINDQSETNVDDQVDELLEDVLSYSWWKKNYKNL